MYKRKFFKSSFSKDFIDSKVHLTVRDYVIWSLIVGMVFLVWMWAGNWGAPPRPIRPDTSPVSQYVFTPYAVVYIGAGVVTALFMGSIIFFISLERGRGMERGKVMELANSAFPLERPQACLEK